MKKFLSCLLVAAMIPVFSSCDDIPEINPENVTAVSEKSALTAEEAKEKRLEYVEQLYEAKAPHHYEDRMGEPEELIEAYEKNDKILNDIYGYLKEVMTEEDFKKLEKEEIEWIKQKEADAENEYNENLDCNCHDDDYCAEQSKYSSLYSATGKRCYYLLMHIGESGREKRLEFLKEYEHIFDNLDESLTYGTQMEMNQYAGERYTAAEDYYNNIVEYHRENMSSEEFKAFEKDENEWKNERDAVVEKYLDRNYYGSAAPLTAYEIGVQYTYFRSQYIIALIG